MKVRGSGGRLFTSGEGPPTLVTSGLVLHLDITVTRFSAEFAADEHLSPW